MQFIFIFIVLDQDRKETLEALVDPMSKFFEVCLQLHDYKILTVVFLVHLRQGPYTPQLKLLTSIHVL